MFYNKICEEILHNDSHEKEDTQNTTAHSHEQAEDNNLINYYYLL